MRPPLLCLQFCALSALVSLSAKAQTSVYATAGIANYGFSHLYSNDLSYKGDTPAVAGGVFYDFPIKSRVTVGADGNVDASFGNKGGFLLGAALRIGFVPKRNPLRPFFQLGGGVVHSSYAPSQGSRSVTNGALQLAFGLDVRLTDHYDLRIPEYGAEADGGSGIKAGAGFLQVGVVYHLHPRA